ncbi:MAG: LptA/OstA family protein [Alphaproteobacteria bacterium]
MTRDAIITQQLGGRRALFTAFVVMTAIAFISAIFAAAPSAHAQAPSTALSKNFQANSGKPIDIQSNMLEVDDNRKVATFRGNVVAIQGGFKLRSKELVVLYSTSTPSGKRPTKKASSSASSGNGEIRQIKAKGRVIITTEDNQKATGELAVFQVQKQLVLLTGNVKVMQGGNIIACEKVVANLATGITTMVPKKRIRAIFQTGTPKSK